MADDTPTPAGLVSVAAGPQPAPPAEPWWKKNLKPVQKGQVLNPDGSNGRKWREELREFFDQPDDDGETISRFHDVLLAIYKAALKGKEGAQRLIVEHMVGKPRETVDLNNPDGNLRGGTVVMLRFPTPEEVEAERREVIDVDATATDAAKDPSG